MDDVDEFLAVVTRLAKLLTDWPDRRDAIFSEHRNDPQAIDAAIKPQENNLLEGLNLAYLTARRLKLPSDPAPLLNALMPADDEDEDANIRAAKSTLLQLLLDAKALRSKPIDPTNATPATKADFPAWATVVAGLTVTRHKELLAMAGYDADSPTKEKQERAVKIIEKAEKLGIVPLPHLPAEPITHVELRNIVIQLINAAASVEGGKVFNKPDTGKRRGRLKSEESELRRNAMFSHLSQFPDLAHDVDGLASKFKVHKKTIGNWMKNAAKRSADLAANRTEDDDDRLDREVNEHAKKRSRQK